MQDRIPLYPGRVKMTPVAGQANTFDMVRADDPTQAGTPLNKATFLKDATAALFGLGTGAVPDDVLAELGKYKQYWWRRRTPSYVQYIEQRSDIQSTYDIIRRSIPLTYSKDIHITPETGEISLVSPTKLELGNGEREDAERVGITLAAEAPCYIQTTVENGAGIYYLPLGTTYSTFDSTTLRRNYGSYYYVILNYPASPQGQVVTSVPSNVPAGEWEYLTSSDRNAYPDSGTQDGYEYEYLGVPFDNAVTAPKIEVGSYVGTGTYGQANPNTLTFGFVPKLVWIYEANTRYISTSAGYNGLWFASWPYLSYLLDSGTTVTRYASLSGETLSWYESSSAFNQLNDSEKVYTYIAIG
jgi:hypothetical protein